MSPLNGKSLVDLLNIYLVGLCREMRSAEVEHHARYFKTVGRETPYRGLVTHKSGAAPFVIWKKGLKRDTPRFHTNSSPICIKNSYWTAKYFPDNQPANPHREDICSLNAAHDVKQRWKIHTTRSHKAKSAVLFWQSILRRTSRLTISAGQISVNRESGLLRTWAYYGNVRTQASKTRLCSCEVYILITASS